MGCICVDNTVNYGGVVNDGINKTSDLINNVITLIRQIVENIPTFVTVAANVLDVTIGVTSLICLAKYTYTLFATTAEGLSYCAKNSWQMVATLVSLIFAKAFSAVHFLNTMKVFQLGSAIATIAIIGNAFILAASTFEVWALGNTIHDSSNQEEKLGSRIDQWIHWADEREDVGTAGIELKIQRWNEKIQTYIDDGGSDSEVLENMNKKKAVWENLKTCSDADYKEFCDNKIEKWKIAKENEAITQKKAWVMIATNIAIVALVILTLVFPAPTLFLTMVSIASVGVAAASLDLTAYILDRIWQTGDLPEFEHGMAI